MTEDEKSKETAAAEPAAPEVDQTIAPGAAEQLPDAELDPIQPANFLSYEELQAECELLKQQNNQLEEAVLRAKADTENLRKRSSKELENAHKYGVERLVAELLPVRDSMELGLSASDDQNVDVGKVREGIDLTLKMLDRAVEKFGLSAVDPTGEIFNPEFHQAVVMQESTDVESGHVISVMQKGYLLHDRLVRPAMVIVAK